MFTFLVLDLRESEDSVEYPVSCLAPVMDPPLPPPPPPPPLLLSEGCFTNGLVVCLLCLPELSCEPELPLESEPNILEVKTMTTHLGMIEL